MSFTVSSSSNPIAFAETVRILNAFDPDMSPSEFVRHAIATNPTRTTPAKNTKLVRRFRDRYLDAIAPIDAPELINRMRAVHGDGQWLEFVHRVLTVRAAYSLVKFVAYVRTREWVTVQKTCEFVRRNRLDWSDATVKQMAAQLGRRGHELGLLSASENGRRQVLTPPSVPDLAITFLVIDFYQRGYRDAEMFSADCWKVWGLTPEQVRAHVQGLCESSDRVTMDGLAIQITGNPRDLLVATAEVGT